MIWNRLELICCSVARASGGVAAASETLVKPASVRSSVKLTLVTGVLASMEIATDPACPADTTAVPMVAST